jgi:hypothetical protein
MTDLGPRRTDAGAAERWSAAAGYALLLYAVLGNYLALPGYRRFLARGGRSEAGNDFDLAVLLGAIKTLVWMFSFPLGAICLAYAALCSHGAPLRRFRRAFLAGAALWLGFWALPRLPAPGALYFAALGCLVLCAIGAVLWLSRQPHSANDSQRGFQILSYLFFALATWEVCGFGSVGRFLHPLEAPAMSGLLNTQATKLMIELLLAWLFALLAKAPAIQSPSASA